MDPVPGGARTALNGEARADPVGYVIADGSGKRSGPMAVALVGREGTRRTFEDMKRTHLLLAVSMAMLCTAGSSLAQESTGTKPRDPRPLGDRLWFGGGVGLAFGTATSIQLDPLVGYKIDQNNKLSAGVGLSYWYYRDSRWAPPLEQNGYGYRIFSRYRPLEQFYAHAEFFHLNGQVYRFADRSTVRLWVPHLLLGGGYVQPLGGNSSIFFQVLFDVLQDPNSVYGNQPIFSGGVGIGF